MRVRFALFLSLLLLTSTSLSARKSKQAGNASTGTPAAIIYSTYVGRTDSDTAQSVAVGADGSLYIAGLAAAAGAPSGRGEAFVAHLSADGSTLLYLTYLGGSDDTVARAIAIDSSGNAYVTGETHAIDFPVRNALQATCSLNTAHQCAGDAFLTKLNADGSVAFSTYLGGSGEDGGNAIALDATGDIYIAGATSSTDFPVFEAVQTAPGGGGDGFVAKIAGDGSRVLYATYLGGRGADEIQSIAVDGAGNAYVTGATSSVDFPAVKAFQASCRLDSSNKCNGEAFVAKLSADGSALLYSTYMGGSGGDVGNAIAVDAAGNAYVAGVTSSVDFPVHNAFQSALKGSSEAFVTKLAAGGAAIVYSTFLGGSAINSAYGIFVDAAGDAFVSGQTNSADFPVVSPVQAACKKNANGGCTEDAFVAVLNSAGSHLAFASYLGGSGTDGALGIAEDLQGAVYLAGATNSVDFPSAKPAQLPKSSSSGNNTSITKAASATTTPALGGGIVAKIGGLGALVAAADAGGSPAADPPSTCVAGSSTIWVGGSGNWSTASNWSTGSVPNSLSTNVCINDGVSTGIQVTLDTSVSVGTLTIDSGNSLIIGNNQELTVGGNISNSGQISISATANTTVLAITGAVSLSGGGTLTLTTSGAGGGAYIYQATGGSVLTNVDNTILGQGQIGYNGLSLVNQSGGTINANVSGATLLLNTGSMTNQGLAESTTGILEFAGMTVANAGGNITANGSSSTVQFVGTTIQAGTLNNTIAGGVLGVPGGSSDTLDGGTTNGSVTINGIYSIANDSQTTVLGTINNTGTIQIAATANTTALIINGAVSLTGAGTVTLSTTGAGGGAYIYQATGGSVLTNVNNTIQGQGQIGYNGLAVVNQKTINANVSAATLLVNLGTLTNSSLLEATGGGILQVSSATVNNAGGNITATGSGSTVQLVSSTIQGGTLNNTTAGGILGVPAGSADTLDGSTASGLVTINGIYSIANGGQTNLVGTITNTGTIQINASASTTALGITNGVTLNGGGTVTLSTTGAGGAYIYQTTGNSVLTNFNNIIQGTGQIGYNNLALVNQAGGVIDANQNGLQLLLNPLSMTNQGMLEATSGGILTLTGTTFVNAGTSIVSNGAGSNVQIVSATIQGGTLSTTGGGVLGIPAGDSATLDGSTASGSVTIAGTFTIANSSLAAVVGTISNTGTIQIAAAANTTALSVNGAVSLTGAGTVTLSTTGAGGAYIYQATGGSVLTNVNNTLQGVGQIGYNGLGLINQATINANVLNSTLLLTLGTFTNQGTLEATGGGILQLNSSTINNATGTILVNGATSSVLFAGGVTIQAGTLATSNGGLLGVATGNGMTLDGSTLGALNNTGTYVGANNSTTAVLGTINNTGAIQIAATANTTALIINGAVSLTGAGTVTLSTTGAGGGAYIYQATGGSVLTNVNNTLQGVGQIGYNGLGLVNRASVLANVSGGPLLLNPGSFTNPGGVLEAIGGGVLQLSGTTINNAGGTIMVNGATSIVQFAGGATIQSGTLATANNGVLGAAANNNITLDGSTLGTLNNTGTFVGANNTTTTVLGTINNTGAIQIAATANTTALNINGAVSLTGAGTVTLSTTGAGGAYIFQATGGSVLTNAGNTIQGVGQIGYNGLALVNKASVLANVSGSTLLLTPGSLTNQGVLEALSGGILQLSNSTINNAAGTIMVNGATSIVQFAGGATIQGGTLATANSGVLEVASGNSITLDGSTLGALNNTGTYVGANNSTTNVLGTINNTGAIQIAATANTTALNINGPVSLTGAGTVTLSTSGAGGGAFIYQATGGSVLTNVGNTIQGTGQIGYNGLAVINQGTIDANAASPLLLNPSTLMNVGILEAFGGGALVLSNSAINNAGGEIMVNGATSSVQFVNAAVISGGTLATANGGVLGVASGNSITLDGSTQGTLNNTGMYTASNNSTTNLLGTINNTGAIQVAATANTTALNINGAVSLTGAGTVTLSTTGAGGGAYIYQASGGSVLTNVGNTILGTGQIGYNGLALVNQGTIEANTTSPLLLNPVSLTNQGLLEAITGGVLQLSNSTISNNGGTIEVNGATSSVQFVNGTTIQGGTLTTANSGVLGSVAGNTITLDGTANTLTIAAGGTYTIADNSTTNIQGTINNAGTLTLNSSGDPTFLTVPTAQIATLTGAGTVSMTSNSANTINGPALTNSGNTIQDQAAFNVTAFTQDSGSIVIAPTGTASTTTFTVSGGTAQVDGTLAASSGVSVPTGGSLFGAGTINGNVTVNGEIQGGDQPASGILTISGADGQNYTQDSTGAYNVVIGGTAAGTQYSQLSVAGAATLAGTLNVSLINDFAPAEGNQFIILTAGSTSGAFTTTNLPALSGSLAWTVITNPTSVVLSVGASGATLTSIAVTPTNPSVGVGSTLQFTATGTYSDGSMQNLTNSVAWASLNPAAATITSAGLAKGVTAGQSATITATQGAVVGQTTLTVTAATLSSIAVTPTNPSIAAGNTLQFTATGTYSDGSMQNLTTSVTWASLNTAAATISTTGVAKGVTAGQSATITATQGAVVGQTTLSVTAAALSSIAVTPANPSVAVGNTLQFTATGTFSDGSTQNLTGSVTWASLNTTAASITSAGLAKGVTAGQSATITATQGAVVGQTTLTVTTGVTLTVTLAGAGTGTVQSADGQINCPTSSCMATYAIGASATLTATGTNGSSFSGWSGDCTNVSGACVLTMSQARNVTATFAASTAPVLQPAPGTNPVVTVPPGSNVIFPLLLSGPPGITITLGCSSDQPTITCTISPLSVTLPSTGITQTTINVITYCSWGVPRTDPPFRLPPAELRLLWFVVLAALSLLAFASIKRRKLAFALPFALLLMGAALGCASPAKGPAGATPAGTYHLTITAKTPSGATGTIVLTINVT